MLRLDLHHKVDVLRSRYKRLPAGEALIDTRAEESNRLDLFVRPVIYPSAKANA